MFINRSQFLEKTKEYLNTPFRHQGRIKGVGIDCVGVPIAVSKEFGISDIKYTNYKRLPDGNTLITMLGKYCDPVSSYDDIKLSDLLVFRIETEPQHVGVYAGNDTFIHSYYNAHKVLLSELDSYWKERIVAIFRIRELIDD